MNGAIYTTNGVISPMHTQKKIQIIKYIQDDLAPSHRNKNAQFLLSAES